MRSVRRAIVRSLNAVVDDREEVVITRSGHDPVVIVSREDYESLTETAYLLRSPANARRLLDSIGRLEAGEGVHDAAQTSTASSTGPQTTRFV